MAQVHAVQSRKRISPCSPDNYLTNIDFTVLVNLVPGSVYGGGSMERVDTSGGGEGDPRGRVRGKG